MSDSVFCSELAITTDYFEIIMNRGSRHEMKLWEGKDGRALGG